MRTSLGSMVMLSWQHELHSVTQMCWLIVAARHGRKQVIGHVMMAAQPVHSVAQMLGNMGEFGFSGLPNQMALATAVSPLCVLQSQSHLQPHLHTQQVHTQGSVVRNVIRAEGKHGHR